MRAFLLLTLCACGARTDLGGTKTSSSDAQADAPDTCHDEIIATDAKGAGALAIDGDAVFWGTEDGLVRARDHDGVVVTLATESDAISSVAVQGQYVYYALTGSIRRVPRTGGPVEQVISNAGQPFALTPQGADLFWVDYGAGIAAGSVHKNDAKIITELDTPSGFAVDGSRVFVACALAIVNQLGVLGPLLGADTNGAGVATVADGLHQPGGLTTYGGRIYYIEQTDAQSTLHGGVRSVDETGGIPNVELTTDDYLPIDVAVDASGVYATAYSQAQSSLFHGAKIISTTPGVFYEAVRTSATAIYMTIAWTSTPPSGSASVQKLCKSLHF